MTRAERLEFYAGHVRKAGFIPQVESGEVRFKAEGQLFQIVLDDEEQYFSMVHHRFWAARDNAQLPGAEDAALATVARTKVAKVWIAGNHASASVELYLQPGDMPAVFERLVGVLQFAVDVFKQELAARAR